jgi:hypothetical protein
LPVAVHNQVYTEEERTQLVGILESALPREECESELIPARRVVKELEGAARDVIQEFGSLRDGRLNERVATIRKLEELSKAANLIRERLREAPVRRAVAEYGPPLPDDADRLVVRLISAADFYVNSRRNTPRGIKSEGKAHSRHLASALLDTFLVFASIAFRDATGRGPRPNKTPNGGPSGPYAKFVLLSVVPLAREFECYRPGLLDMTWPGLAQRLVKSVKVREIALLRR